jgi:hypothetical protein
VIDETEQLRGVLEGTPLEALSFQSTPVLDTGLVAFEAETGEHDRYVMWRAARELVDVTGRWPLLVWEGAPNLYLRNVDTHGDPAAAAPAAILERGRAMSLADAIDKRRAGRAGDERRYAVQEWDWHVERELRLTRARIGDRAPSNSEVARIVGAPDLDRLTQLLFDVEEHHRPTTAREPHPDCVPWQDEERTLVLLPTSHGHEVPAFADYNICTGWQPGEGQAALIAALRSWDERFGAELMVNGFTWLHLRVARPPTDVSCAHLLARELRLFGLPDPEDRTHARDLIGRSDWYLEYRM